MTTIITAIQYMPKFVLSILKIEIINPQKFSRNLFEHDPSLKNKIYLLSSWHAKKPLFTDHDRKIITYLFEPNKKARKKINSQLKTLRKHYSTIIGVHIRQGDYKQYRGGNFYFPDLVYKNIMHHISNQINGNACFIICSTDQINCQNFSGLTAIQQGQRAIEDLYTLSQCDYIFGPPSSFSMWVSFYGQLKFVTSANDKPNLQEFSLFVQQNIFANSETY